LFNMRYADVLDVKAAGAFADVAVYRAFDANLTDGGLPERVQAYRLSPNAFEVLGVEAALGRVFGVADVEAGQSRVVVLSHGIWTRRFGADPGVVGREIGLNGQAFTVVGVMPRAFEFPIFNFKGDLWTPLVVTPEWTPASRGDSPSVVAIARLASGVSLASAQSATEAVMSRLAVEWPDTNSARAARVVPMGQMVTGQAGPVFLLLMVAGVLVLLVACLNVANLLLARAVGRGREFAVRAAMGAGRMRLLRQLLAESVLLAVAGGACATVLTWWALDALRRAMPDFVHRVVPGTAGVAVDGVAVGFAAGLSLMTVLIFGLLPAWQSSGVPAREALAAGARHTGSRRRRWLRQSLVVAEVAFSAALLVTTVLIGRSADRLVRVDPGFDQARLLALSVALPSATYPDPAARETFFERLATRLTVVPGITGVGLTSTLPFSTSNSSMAFEVDGVARPEGPPPMAGLRIVTPGYFQAMGMRVVRGRGFDVDDGRDGRQTTIVNRAFASRYLAEGEALGRTLRLDAGTASPLFTIAGVVSDVKHDALTEAAVPELYLPYALVPRTTMTLAVRVEGDPAAVAGAARSALAKIDPALAAYDVAPMSELIRNSMLPQVLASGVMRVFSVGALLLATVGLYGVLAFAVGQRTREIGVRMALGATRRDLLRLVLRQSLWLVVLGLGMGLGIAALGARGLAVLLFGVGPLDPASYAATAVALAVVGLVASWVPARRALAVDPVVALRAD
jgi:predicted permease